MSRVFYVVRGLPGSGKTTYAKEWVKEDPEHRARFNRDDLRDMVHAGVYIGKGTEYQIVHYQQVLIREALSLGNDVVCDDTNLNDETVDRLVLAARSVVGVLSHIIDFRHVPLEVCVARDVARGIKGGNMIGREVIEDMSNREIWPWQQPDGSVTDQLFDPETNEPIITNPKHPDYIAT